jgi:hypothetical protein
MPLTLSVDLRARCGFGVGGASCRAAASRFGVSAASASRWSRRLHASLKPFVWTASVASILAKLPVASA